MNFLCRRGFFARKCQGGRLFACGEFRRLRAASDFAPGGKVPKRRRGRLQRGTVPVLLVALPRTPIRGYPLKQAENFRRAKSEWVSKSIPAHWGPGFVKIKAGAVPPPRLGFPNQRYRAAFRRRGGPLTKGAQCPAGRLGRLQGTSRFRRGGSRTPSLPLRPIPPIRGKFPKGQRGWGSQRAGEGNFLICTPWREAQGSPLPDSVAVSVMPQGRGLPLPQSLPL